MLVAASLSLLCLGILIGMFLPSVVLFQQQSSLANAQQLGAVVMDRLRNGILCTVPETVAVKANKHAVSWRPCDPKTPFSLQGTPNLLAHFDVYSWDPTTKELSYTFWAPAGYDFTLVKPLPANLFPTAPTPQTRVLARDVTNFQVAYPVQLPLPVLLTISPPSPHSKPSWTLQQKFMPHLTI